VRKLYCVNRAVPNLPINIEDAARSEKEFEKAELVSDVIALFMLFFYYWSGQLIPYACLWSNTILYLLYYVIVPLYLPQE